ncbi:peptidase inhibitor family I36 protein [Microbispora sp. NPDC049125]|uniref:peptidase inhibitor family I36 protein n=1 Tax=Microbispora sp. NPDC049125 TaxID=3154929 RepID=UPI00346637AB
MITKASKLLHLAAVTAVIAATTLVSAAPAQADTCPAGSWCLWTERGFTGYRYQAAPSPTFGDRNPLPEPINEDTFSVINNTAKAIRIYRGADFSGSHTCIQPGGSIGDLTLFSVGQFGSSVKWGGPNTCG